MQLLKRALNVCLVALAASFTAAAAEQWEAGVLAGASRHMNNSVSGAAGSGEVGHEPGFVAGGFAGHDSTPLIGGEIRYLFEKSDLKLSSGSTKYTFKAQSHAIHYDLLVHFAKTGSAVRPFLAFGGGIKQYIGTAKDNPLQPLANVAILTHTQEWKPLATFGGGVKFQVGGKSLLRIEVRDYMTPVPKDVILPVPPNKISGWIHNINPMVAISIQFR
jgi:hypothetical protein